MFNLRKKFDSLYINIYTDGTKDIRMFGGENLDVRGASDSQVEFYGRQAEKEGLTRHDTTKMGQLFKRILRIRIDES